MPKYPTLKADKVKKVHLPSRCKKHNSVLCKNNQKYNVHKIVSGSLTDGIFVTQNNELVELTAQLAKLKVSRNRTMTWKLTKNHKILTRGNEVQATFNFSQDNTKDFMQHEDMSQISLSPRSKTAKTTNRFSIVQRKNISMEDKRQGDGTLMMSTDDKLKTKNLIINQVGYTYRKFVLLLTDILLFLLIQIFCIIQITV